MSKIKRVDRREGRDEGRGSRAFSMNVAVLGRSEWSVVVKKNIEERFNPKLCEMGKPEFSVRAFLEPQTVSRKEAREIDGKAIINLFQFQTLYHKKILRGIILPREVFLGQTTIISEMIKVDIDMKDVYIMGRIEANGIIKRIDTYWGSKYLPYLEFHIADQCNLNCVGCEHYSGLVKTPKFPDPNQFTRDMEQLHKFIDDIGVIRILGGEPLLNRDINYFVRLTRRLYPDANIIVLTNGLSLMSMPEDFFETMRQNQAIIQISLYKPLLKKINEIYQFIQSKGIPILISDLNTHFTIKQTLKKHDKPREIFLDCFQSHCHNLYEGKLAACFLPFTTKYFNAYFGKNLPEDGAIDLYDPNLTTAKIKARLLQPFERCRYCTPPVLIEWATIKNPSVLSDWINNDLES